MFLEGAPSAPASEEIAEDSYERLSPRERQVLRLIALGHTNQQVADMLCLSVKTIETYRQRIMKKWGVNSTTALVRLALWRGYVPQP